MARRVTKDGRGKRGLTQALTPRGLAVLRAFHDARRYAPGFVVSCGVLPELSESASERLHGIVLAQAGDPKSQPAMVQLANGSRVAGKVASLADGELQLELQGGAKASLSLDSVERIELRSARLTFLSDLDPVSVKEETIFTPARAWQRAASPCQTHRMRRPPSLRHPREGRGRRMPQTLRRPCQMPGTAEGRPAGPPSRSHPTLPQRCPTRRGAALPCPWRCLWPCV